MNNNSGRRPDPRQGNAQQRPKMTRERYESLSPEERARYDEYVRRKRAAAAQHQKELEREKRNKQRRKKRVLTTVITFSVVFLVALIVVASIAVIGFTIKFRSAPDAPKDNGKITYYYGGREARSASAEDCVTLDGVYVCFNDLSDYLGMSESGTAEEMKFILPSEDSYDSSAGSGREEYIIFISDGYGVIVNGQSVRVDMPNLIRGTEVWVTADFVEDYVLNLSVQYNEKKGTVSIARIKDEENSTDDLVVYLPVSFSLKNSAPLPSVDDPDDPNDGSMSPEPEPPLETLPPETTPPEPIDPVLEAISNVEFITDLSAYEQYMNPQGDMRDSFLILVNTKNHLTANDIPPDLTAPIYRNWESKPLREYAARALEALFLEFNAAGFWNSNLAVRSAYRDYANQDYLFNYYTQREMTNNPSLTREEAEKIVLTFSTRPGTSEHQTGLAVDMDTTGLLVTDFQYSEEYKWLSENAWKFGFILRFPADKMDITTIQFEPWHYRYVGRYHAYKIHEAGICLEEYIEMLKGE